MSFYVRQDNALRQRARATAINVSVNLRCARSVARACWMRFQGLYIFGTQRRLNEEARRQANR